jgi:GNAT superfamily N-acetyltransferase
MRNCPHDDSWLLVRETFIIGCFASLQQPIRAARKSQICIWLYTNMPHKTQHPVTAPKARPAVEIRRAELRSSDAQSLILALNQELESRYPEDGANFFKLDPDEVREGCGGFFVAYLNGEPVGCGAIRQIAPGTAEFKRMYVAPEARGLGIAGQMVAALEADAMRLGMSRLVLETGPRQPEAIAVYRRAGFESIPLFGEYVGSKFSVCMAKDLTASR